MINCKNSNQPQNILESFFHMPLQQIYEYSLQSWVEYKSFYFNLVYVSVQIIWLIMVLRLSAYNSKNLTNFIKKKLCSLYFKSPDAFLISIIIIIIICLFFSSCLIFDQSTCPIW